MGWSFTTPLRAALQQAIRNDLLKQAIGLANSRLEIAYWHRVCVNGGKAPRQHRH